MLRVHKLCLAPRYYSSSAREKQRALTYCISSNIPCQAFFGLEKLKPIHLQGSADLHTTDQVNWNFVCKKNYMFIVEAYFTELKILKMTFRALVLRQPSHVVNSVDKTKPSDYVIVCVRVPPSRVPPPLSFLFVFDLDSSKALTN